MADMWKACTSLGQAAVEAMDLLGLAIDDATSDCFIAGMTDVMAEAQAGSIIAGEVFADTELIIDASAIGARCGAAALTIRPGGDVTIADGAALFVDALTAQLAATDDPADFGFVDSEAECFAGGVVDAIGSDDIAASGVNAGQLGLYLRQALSPTDLGIELDVDQLDALTVLFLNCVDYFRIQAEAGSGAATELGLADPEAIEQMIDCMRELADPDLVPAEIRLRFEYGLDAFEQDAFRDILATWIDLGFQCAVVPEVQPFVGLAYDIGGTGDGTFNDAAAAGAARAADELGVEVFELQADTVSQRGVVLRNLTDSGASPIVANGFGFSVALEDVAWRNPFTQYAIVDGVIPNAPPNVTFISFAEHEGSFLVGAAAALHCGCETIGFIGGQNIDVINRFLAGYTAGAEYIDPDINVRVRYLGFASDATAWSSPDEAHQIAAAWYDEGVEVIFSAAGASGEGTRRAAAESDAWAIGVDSDEWVIAPEEQRPHILTSMLKRIDVAVYDIYASSLDSTLSGGFRVYDLAAGGVGYARSGDHLADHYDTLDQIDQQIRDGDIIVPDSL
jgi:basic membrane protein A